MFGLFKKKTDGLVKDQSERDQLEQLLRNPLFSTVELLPGVDELEDGYGAFGSVTNPIPVNGAIGEVVYLNRLRGPTGAHFFYHRPGSRAFDERPYPLDGFEILAADGSMFTTIWFSMYHPRRSRLAPEGMTLKPFPKDTVEQAIVRSPGSGVPSRVSPFPEALPAAVEEAADQFFPGTGPMMAGMVADGLSQLELVAEPQFAKGPLNLVLQHQEGGTFAFLLDRFDRQVDSCLVPLPRTYAQVQSLAREEALQGSQALLPFAVLDLQALTADERRIIANAAEVHDDDHFLLIFLLYWLSHELQGRPREDGGFGERAEALCLCHWADLPQAGGLGREVRRILNALESRR